MPFDIGGYIYNGNIADSQDYKNIITRGLILNFDASAPDSYPGSGTTWYDMSGNNNGTLTNGPTYSSSNGGSIVFDGSNDYVVVPHNSVFNLTSAISFSFWFKTTRTVDSYITTKQEDSFYIGVGPSGITANKMSFYLNGTSGGWLQSVSNVGTGDWINATLTWDGSTSRIYLNGALDNSGSRPGTMLTGTSNITLGARLNTFNNIVGTLLGNLGNFLIYNRTLSAAEALQNFNVQRGRFGV
jgi:hypothetical protein